MTDERFKELVKLATEQTQEVMKTGVNIDFNEIFTNIFGSLMVLNDPHRVSPPTTDESLETKTK